MPSGRVIGAEINDCGNLVPHEWDCDCDRCDPVAEAKRQRVRDAGPELLEALRLTWEQLQRDGTPMPADLVDSSAAAIAKAVA